MQQMYAEVTKPGAPYEVTMNTIRGIEYRVFANAPRNLRDVYASSLDDGHYYIRKVQEWYPEDDGAFLVYQDERYTFDEAYQTAAGFAELLKSKFNIKKGDRVVIAMRNCPEYCLAFMAITAIGALAVPMNAWWQGEELAYGIQDCEPRLIIADQRRMDRMLAHISDRKIPILVSRHKGQLPAGVLPLAELLLDQKLYEFPHVGIQPDDDAYIMYTSGSTGKPKGVVATHRAVISTLMSWQLPVMGIAATWPDKAKQLKTPFRSAMLLSVPLFHVTGLLGGFLVGFSIRMKTVMMYKWDAEEALRLVEKERIARVMGPPVITWDLVNSPLFEKTDTSSLFALGAGGAQRPPEHLKVMAERMGRHIAVTNYGLTETTGLGATNSGENYLKKPSSVGKPTPPLMEAKIVDQSGRDLPIGSPGEICLKGVANFRCYWKNEEATSRAMLNGGWFRTGDSGYIDEDGDIFIKDRLKEIIIRGGENISSREVEFAICEHPQVFEATVFGLPDEKMGEKVAAVVVPKRGQELNEDSLRAFLIGNLAAFKIPEHIWLQPESLPKLASGKVFKRGIRKDKLELLS